MFTSLKAAFLTAIICWSFFAGAQENKYSLEMLSHSVPTNLRGLCPVNDNVIWACGNNGHIARTVSGGIRWGWKIPTGYEKADFRDIYAFDSLHAVVMASGTPAVILYTDDGGAIWKEVYRNNDTAVFLDALDFWDDTTGFCFGDWVAGKPFILTTGDGGKTWQEENYATMKPVKDTLAAFAASGTCARAKTTWALGRQHRFILAALGGSQHLVFVSQEKSGKYETAPLPYPGKENTQGIFSMAVDTVNALVWFAGGDYKTQADGYSITMDAETGNFALPVEQVKGYRSCIELFYDRDVYLAIACGLTGADITYAHRQAAWKNISTLPLNTVVKARKGNAVFLVGPQGTIYRLVVEDK